MRGKGGGGGVGRKGGGGEWEKEYDLIYMCVLRGTLFLNNGAFIRVVIFKLRRKVTRLRVEPRTSGLIC